MKLTFRKSAISDLQHVWQIIKDAKRIMLENGRHQWTEEYPSYDRIESDIMSGDAYVACNDKGLILAYAYITSQPEPAYDSPTVNWLSHDSYMVIHRLAVSAASRGIGLGKAMLQHAEQICHDKGISSIKVDTNYDNVEMLHLLSALGYTHCGTVSYGARGERLAFEKLI